MIGQDVVQEIDDLAEEADNSFIPLSDPDITTAELEAVDAVLRSPRISTGPATEAFERRSRRILAENMR
jgi:perosamine synthetase